MGKIYEVSDWHLADETGPSTPNHKRMNDFLDMVGKSPLRIKGDLFEGWRNTWNEIMAGPSLKIMERLRHMDVDIILGNHDRKLRDVIEAYFGKPTSESMYVGTKTGKRTIVHGDWLDPLLDTEWKQEASAIFARFVFEANQNSLNEAADAIARRDRTNTPLIENSKKTGGWWDVGHSHQPIDLTDGDYRFINSGGWLKGEALCFITEDEDTGQLTLVQFAPGQEG